MDHRPGRIDSYVDPDGGAAALVEVRCSSSATLDRDGFRELVRSLCLHVAAQNPLGLSRQQFPARPYGKERDRLAEQHADKDPRTRERLVSMALGDFVRRNCLLTQRFALHESKTVEEILDERASELGDQLEIVRFVRFGLGGDGATGAASSGREGQ